MFLFTDKITKIVILIVMVFGFTQAQAQTVGDEKFLTRDQIILMVGQQLPSMIGNDNTGLVDKMLKARLGLPISQQLNIAGSLRTIFGRRRPVLDPGCQRQFTRSGDLSPDECTASNGDRAGQGAYMEFRWSKNLNFGNVQFLQRNADGVIKPGELPVVKLTDEEAYNRAVAFLTKTMGVTPDEIPVAPANANQPFSVRTLAVGENTPDGKKNIVPIAKVVDIKRGLFVDIKDPLTRRDLPYIPAPGRATVVVTDSAILQASVQKWKGLRLSPKIDSKNAKTRSELINEIANSILKKQPTQISKISFMLAIESMDLVGNDPSKESQASLLLPAVQAVVSNVPRNPTEEEQQRFESTTAGYSEWFSLVDVPEENGSEDDES